MRDLLWTLLLALLLALSASLMGRALHAAVQERPLATAHLDTQSRSRCAAFPGC